MPWDCGGGFFATGMVGAGGWSCSTFDVPKTIPWVIPGDCVDDSLLTEIFAGASTLSFRGLLTSSLKPEGLAELIPPCPVDISWRIFAF